MTSLIADECKLGITSHSNENMKLIENIEIGYKSEKPPSPLNSLTKTDEAKMLGYILSQNGKSMPTEINYRNGIFFINDDAKAVMTLPKDNKPGAVYMNGDKRSHILRGNA